MLLFLFLVFLCSNFLFIKSEDCGIVRIEVQPPDNCTLKDTYTFTEGQNILLFVYPTNFMNHGWWRHINGTDGRILSDKIDSHTHTHTKIQNSPQDDKPPVPTEYTTVVNKSMEGTWEFTFYLLKNTPQVYLDKTITNENGTFVPSICRTEVKIVPPPAAASNTDLGQTTIIACAVGAVLVAIIVAQAAYIVFLKIKAQKLITLNTHNNLSKKSDAAPEDIARYCSNPGQKMMKVAAPVDDDNNRDSVIYEAPNIEIPSNPRMPMQPPQPPAITTMPRTPRPDHNTRIHSQAAMLASALNSPARSPISENFPPNFQKPNHNDLANRPRLPLPNTLHDTPLTIPKHNPHEQMFQEVYEEMEPTEENTYEPPPIINAMPPRLPMPPKKVPTGNLLDVKENTLKLRQGNRPPVTPKPARPRSNVMSPPNELEQALRRRHDTMGKPTMTPMQQELAMRKRPIAADSQTNELEEALKRRNNVKHVPTVSSPDPSSRESPKPRPQPSKLRGQPIPQPVQEEVMQAPIASNPDHSSSEPSNSKPKPPSKPWGPPAPHQVQEGPPPSRPRGAPIPQPVQEEIYFNENQASSDEEWIYEPLKPIHSYDRN